MDLSTQLLLAGAVSFVTPRVSYAACPPGHFSCHDDCCINEVQFCNNHETQKRCQKCELRKTECGTPNVHPHCFLFCRDFLAANSTTASPTPVLTPGILTAIVVLCVLVVIFASACVIVIKRPAWLTRIARRSWYRLVCRGRTKLNPVNSADRDVEALPNEQPNLGDLSLRGCQHAEGTPLLDRSGGSPANRGQAAEGAIEDTTVLASLHKRQSNGSLEPDTSGPAIPGDRREAREASITSRAERPPALQREVLQQRDLSDADRPSSRSPGGMASSSQSSASAGTSSVSDGAASSLASSQASPSSAGTTSGRRRSDNDSPRRRGEGDERGDGGSTTRCFHDDARPGAGHPPNDDNGHGPSRQREGSVVQSNHTSIIMNFNSDTAHRQRPADVTVSSPSTSAYFVHNGVPPGGTNAHQASAGDGGNPSRQPQQQNQNGSADQTPRCHGLHTNPTNPPDGDPGHTAEIATANDSQSTHQHYYHIPKPPA